MKFFSKKKILLNPVCVKRSRGKQKRETDIESKTENERNIEKKKDNVTQRRTRERSF